MATLYEQADQTRDKYTYSWILDATRKASGMAQWKWVPGRPGCWVTNDPKLAFQAATRFGLAPKSNSSHSVNGAPMKLPAPIRSWSNLLQRACDGELAIQQAIIDTLHNFGCEHLAGRRGDKWERHYAGLEAYIMSLVGEYGESEVDAETEVMAEVNLMVELALK